MTWSRLALAAGAASGARRGVPAAVTPQRLRLLLALRLVALAVGVARAALVSLALLVLGAVLLVAVLLQG